MAKYAIEQHSGGSKDVGMYIKRFNKKSLAKKAIKQLRKKDDEYGYRLVKLPQYLYKKKR